MCSSCYRADFVLVPSRSLVLLQPYGSFSHPFFLVLLSSWCCCASFLYRLLLRIIRPVWFEEGAIVMCCCCDACWCDCWCCCAGRVQQFLLLLSSFAGCWCYCCCAGAVSSLLVVELRYVVSFVVYDLCICGHGCHLVWSGEENCWRKMPSCRVLRLAGTVHLPSLSVCMI